MPTILGVYVVTSVVLSVSFSVASNFEFCMFGGLYWSFQSILDDRNQYS